MAHRDPKASNTLDRPNQVVPRKGGDAHIEDGRLKVALPRASWNVIHLQR